MLTGCPLVYSGYAFAENKSEMPVEEVVQKSISAILGLNENEEIDFSETLADLGMDSLAGFELKNFLTKNYNINLTIKELKQMSVDSVVKLVNT